jgi:hypothetical protein
LKVQFQILTLTLKKKKKKKKKKRNKFNIKLIFLFEKQKLILVQDILYIYTWKDIVFKNINYPKSEFEKMNNLSTKRIFYESHFKVLLTG